MKNQFTTHLHLMIFILVFSISSAPRHTLALEPDVIKTNLNPIKSDKCGIDQFYYLITLDGVDLEVCLPFEVDQFNSSGKDELFQVASAISNENHKLVMVQSVPYGQKGLSPFFPEPKAGNSNNFKHALSDEYLGIGSTKSIGPEAIFFGKNEGSIYSINNNVKDLSSLEKVMTTIWVTEAGNRIWIIRIAQDYDQDTLNTTLQEDLKNLTKVKFFSTNLFAPSTSLNALPVTYSESSIPKQPDSVSNDLPFPSWWSGDCNVNNHPGSFPLGGIYRGVKACGPLGSAVPVNFGVGVTQYEWQCPELSKRYLYLAYGIAPYSAHGKDVVWNYSGSRLVKITNGTQGSAPKPGDVISYSGPDTNYGHTSVVSSANVDGNGNGSITIIEQNSSSSGTRTHTVSNWFVQSSFNATGWLHDPGSTPSGYEFCANEGGRCDFSGSASIAYGANGLFNYRDLSNGTDCNNNVFGDPIPGVQKACHIRGGGPPGYNWCANENGRCNFSGTADVAYGASLKYFYKNGITGGIDCNNATFGGDPVYGTPKACYYKSVDSPDKWTANYYDTTDRWWDNNNSANHKCSETINSSFLDKNYGNGAPCGSMDGDTWVGDYSATMNFPSGNYVFWVDHDDGLKLWLNGTNIADRGGSGSTWVCPARNLSGNQQLRAMLREDGGDARVKVTWSTDTSVCNPPPVPTNVQASDGTYTDKVQVTWNTSSGANSYNVYRSTSSSGQAQIGSSSTTSFNDTTAVVGTTYYYWVKACSSYGCSGFSGYDTGWRGGTAPNPPTNFQASDGTFTEKVQLTWDASSGAASYNVYRSTSSSGQTLIGSISTTSYDDTTAAVGTTYYYWIKACNNSGCSDYSTFDTGWRKANAPSNDNFDSPKQITYRPYSHTLNTSGATSEVDDPPFTECNRGPGRATVWYRYTPSVPGSITIDTIGSNYDTMLAVWTGSRGSLNPIACNDDRPEDTRSFLRINISAGTTYFIEVAEYVGVLSPVDEEPKSSKGSNSLLSGGMLVFHLNPANLIFYDSFESGNLSKWSSRKTDYGDLKVTTSAGISGTYGLQVDIDDQVPIYVTDESPNNESHYQVNFWIDPNSINLSTDYIHVLVGYMGTTTKVVEVRLEHFPNDYYWISVELTTDSGLLRRTGWYVYDEPNLLKLDWKASTGPGMNNGHVTLWVNNVRRGNISGVDNDTKRIDRIRLGALSGISVGTNGTYFIDKFESYR